MYSKLQVPLLIRTDLLRPGKNLLPDLQGTEYREMLVDIKVNGIKIPLEVSPNGDGTYTIVSGHQRYRIAKELGIEELPCTINKGSRVSAIYSLEIIRRHLSKQEKSNVEAKRDELEREEMRSEILPKLIPELIENYDSGCLTVDQAAHIAFYYPKEAQLTFLNTFETIIEVVPEDVTAHIKSLEATNGSLNTQIRILQDNFFEKEKVNRKLLRAESERKEEIADEKEKLAKAIQTATGALRKEQEKDIEGLNRELREMSLVANERMRQIEELKETIRSKENNEKLSRANTNAQNIIRTELEQKHKAEMEKCEHKHRTEIAKYARPDLLIKKLIHLADDAEATNQHLESFATAYSSDNKTEMAKTVHRLFMAVERIEKRLSVPKETMDSSTTEQPEKARILPFQKSEATVSVSH